MLAMASERLDDRSSGPGNIKGAAFREFVVWYTKEQGSERLLAAVDALPESARFHLQPRREALGILAATWYPAEVLHSLLDELLRGVPEDERLGMARGAAGVIMRSTLHGIYRVLFRLMATPELYVRFGSRLWSTHYDSGDLILELEEPTHLQATVRNWRGHHPFICQLNGAALVPIFSEMGCVDPNVNFEACVSRGDTECRYSLSWRT